MIDCSFHTVLSLLSNFFIVGRDGKSTTQILINIQNRYSFIIPKSLQMDPGDKTDSNFELGGEV